MFQKLGIWQRLCPEFLLGRSRHRSKSPILYRGDADDQKGRDKVEAKNQFLE
jgi:hypothetical protein